MVTAYWTIAGVTLTIVLNAFLKDREADRKHVRVWIFIALAALLWPVTLPSIVRSKLRRNSTKARPYSKRRERELELSRPAKPTVSALNVAPGDY